MLDMYLQSTVSEVYASAKVTVTGQPQNSYIPGALKKNSWTPSYPRKVVLILSLLNTLRLGFSLKFVLDLRRIKPGDLDIDNIKDTAVV